MKLKLLRFSNAISWFCLVILALAEANLFHLGYYGPIHIIGAVAAIFHAHNAAKTRVLINEITAQEAVKNEPFKKVS